jgi:hypothetical protein
LREDHKILELSLPLKYIHVPFEAVYSRINTLIPLVLSFVEALLFPFFWDDLFGYLALSRSSLLGDSAFDK